ncbi:hypothetical protein CIT31_13065 [Mesorhizobium wenxiniae]|uniref:Uncharacterized protein n=1 Tax=Mesorhizobium wenxiniae TaxID=2014805 RepID=A0A271KGX8_9HYPH|nr:hypothetical protein CIT31_13065 [Mesorhizobium wenxiniae]
MAAPPCLGEFEPVLVPSPRSKVASDRLRMICECEAADIASVRNVQHEAEARFERLPMCWASREIQSSG